MAAVSATWAGQAQGQLPDPKVGAVSRLWAKGTQREQAQPHLRGCPPTPAAQASPAPRAGRGTRRQTVPLSASRGGAHVTGSAGANHSSSRSPICDQEHNGWALMRGGPWAGPRRPVLTYMAEGRGACERAGRSPSRLRRRGGRGGRGGRARTRRAVPGPRAGAALWRSGGQPPGAPRRALVF